MFMSVKRKVSALRKYKSGGDDPPQPLTTLEEQIHLLFEDSSLLKGIGGIESGKSKMEELSQDDQSALESRQSFTPILAETPHNSAIVTPRNSPSFQPIIGWPSTTIFVPKPKPIPVRNEDAEINGKLKNAVLERIELAKSKITLEKEKLAVEKYKLELEVIQLQISLGIIPPGVITYPPQLGRFHSSRLHSLQTQMTLDI